MTLAMVVGAHATRAATPALMSGNVLDGIRAKPRPLTAANLRAVSAWLDEHRSGWQLNTATPPLPLLSVSLNTAEEKGAIRLLLWPGPTIPGWSHAVIMEQSGGIKTLKSDDLAALLQALK